MQREKTPEKVIYDQNTASSNSQMVFGALIALAEITLTHSFMALVHAWNYSTVKMACVDCYLTGQKSSETM